MSPNMSTIIRNSALYLQTISGTMPSNHLRVWRFVVAAITWYLSVKFNPDYYICFPDLCNNTLQTSGLKNSCGMSQVNLLSIQQFIVLLQFKHKTLVWSGYQNDFKIKQTYLFQISNTHRSIQCVLISSQ